MNRIRALYLSFKKARIECHVVTHLLFDSTIRLTVEKKEIGMIGLRSSAFLVPLIVAFTFVVLFQSVSPFKGALSSLHS